MADPTKSIQDLAAVNRTDTLRSAIASFALDKYIPLPLRGSFAVLDAFRFEDLLPEATMLIWFGYLAPYVRFLFLTYLDTPIRLDVHYRALMAKESGAAFGEEQLVRGSNQILLPAVRSRGRAAAAIAAKVAEEEQVTSTNPSALPTTETMVPPPASSPPPTTLADSTSNIAARSSPLHSAFLKLRLRHLVALPSDRLRAQLTTVVGSDEDTTSPPPPPTHHHQNDGTVAETSDTEEGEGDERIPPPVTPPVANQFPVTIRPKHLSPQLWFHLLQHPDLTDPYFDDEEDEEEEERIRQPPLSRIADEEWSRQEPDRFENLLKKTVGWLVSSVWLEYSQYGSPHDHSFRSYSSIPTAAAARSGYWQPTESFLHSCNMEIASLLFPSSAALFSRIPLLTFLSVNGYSADFFDKTVDAQVIREREQVAVSIASLAEEMRDELEAAHGSRYFDDDDEENDDADGNDNSKHEQQDDHLPSSHRRPVTLREFFLCLYPMFNRGLISRARALHLHAAFCRFREGRPYRVDRTALDSWSRINGLDMMQLLHADVDTVFAATTGFDRKMRREMLPGFTENQHLRWDSVVKFVSTAAASSSESSVVEEGEDDSYEIMLDNEGEESYSSSSHPPPASDRHGPPSPQGLTPPVPGLLSKETWRRVQRHNESAWKMFQRLASHEVGLELSKSLKML